MTQTNRLDRAEREMEARGAGAGRALVAYDLSHWKVPVAVQVRCRALAQAGERDAVRAELLTAWAGETPPPDAARLGISDYLTLDESAQLDDDVIYTAMTRRGAKTLAASRRGDRF